MLPSPEIPVAPFSVSELGVSRARGRLRIGVVVLVLLVLALCVLAALSSR